jgi:hypothetical protein
LRWVGPGFFGLGPGLGCNLRALFQAFQFKNQAGGFQNSAYYYGPENILNISKTINFFRHFGPEGLNFLTQPLGSGTGPTHLYILLRLVMDSSWCSQGIFLFESNALLQIRIVVLQVRPVGPGKPNWHLLWPTYALGRPLGPKSAFHLGHPGPDSLPQALSDQPRPDWAPG